MPRDINTFIQKPEQLNRQSLVFLNELIEKYPFFQTARLLHIKNLQNIDTRVDKSELNLTAAYVSDRKTLYYLLHKLPAHSIHKKQPEEVSDIPHVEKEFKDSMKENIEKTINDQISYYKMNSMDEIELIPGLAIDVRKEYGDGIKLDDRTYTIHRQGKHKVTSQEFFELASLSDDLQEEEIEGDIIPAASESVDLIEIDTGILPPADQGKRVEADLKSDVEDEVTKKDKSLEKESLPFTSWLDAIDSKVHKNEDFHPDKELVTLDKEEKEDTESEQENDIAVSSDEKGGQDSLIDKFIETNPRIVPRTDKIKNEDISKESVQEHESFFTDTLARIYIQQGHYVKAIFAYEKLSLKYPEKSAYFAGQISKIKKLIDNS